MNKNNKALYIALPLTLIFILFLWLSRSDSDPQAEQVQTLDHKNVIVLLDLSNRIDLKSHPFQAEMDLKVIKELFGQFENTVRRKLYFNAKDRFIVVVAPQPNDYEHLLYKVSDSLIVDMTRPDALGKPWFDRQKQKFFHNLDKIYSSAAQSRDFPGADIWLYFRDYLPAQLKLNESDGNFKNYLVILTDGYLDFNPNTLENRIQQGKQTTYMKVASLRHKPDLNKFLQSDDFGLIPAVSGLGNLKVLLMEINLRQAGDRSILEAYWFKWFEKMGITSYKLCLRDYSIENSAATIKEFLK